MTFGAMSSDALHNGVLAQTAPDPIITIDEASTILFANAGAETVFGYRLSELVGQPLSMLIPERFRARHAEGIARYVATSQKRISWRGMRVSILAKSGVEIPVEIAFGEFEWDGRRVFSGFLRDVSERVASERTIAEANARLQEQADTLVLQIADARRLANELAHANADAETRVKLVAQSADRARRLLMLSAGLNAASGLADVARLILDEGLAAVRADAGSFALLSSRDGGEAQFEVIRGRGFRADLQAEYRRFPLRPGGPMSDAVVTRAPVLVSSREEACARYPTLADVGFEAFVALPVIVAGQPVAAIGFGFSKPQQFDDPTETFLRTVGELCAQALERARLYEDKTRRATQIGFLAEASMLLASSLDDRVTLMSLVAAAVPTVADICVVDVIDDAAGDEWPPRITRIRTARDSGRTDKSAGPRVEQQPLVDWDSDVGLASVLRDGTTYFVKGSAADDAGSASSKTKPDVVKRGDQALEHVDVDSGASIVMVPLIARGRTLGALTLLRYKGETSYDENDVALATDLASRAAIAVDNAHLFREARRAQALAEYATARAAAASKAKSDFLATMSHEIRTPINAVLGYSELLALELAGPITEEQRAQIERIHASTMHLLTLVNDVLDLAKIESGTMRLDLAEVVADETMNAALSLVTPQATVKGVMISERCTGACESRELRYLGDSDRVRQVLANLIANAVKFTGSGGSVAVRCDLVSRMQHGGSDGFPVAFVAFTVRDSGIGIEAAQLEHIFEAFVQAETAVRSAYTREQPGTGLGLAISKQLAQQMGGSIEVESKLGTGSTFRLLLPVATRLK